MPMYDVVTLGETMIRLTPPNLERVEQAREFQIHVGGTESNTAIGLARLGLKVAWISRLVDNALGHLIAGEIARHSVDVSHVVWTSQDRVGVYFLEEGGPPRGSRVIYDRANSAISKMRPDELPEAVFQPDGAQLLHLTGITVAIGQDAARTCRRAVELAKGAGWLVSFDINYRAKLWPPEKAREGCEPFMQAADLLIIPLKDARMIYELDGDADSALETLAGRYPQATIALTLGAEGTIAREPGGAVYRSPVFPAEAIGRVGRGDAFSAGLLYGYLTTRDLPQALRWGAAAAALKSSMTGDIPFFERDEVAALVAEGVSETGLAR